MNPTNPKINALTPAEHEAHLIKREQQRQRHAAARILGYTDAADAGYDYLTNKSVLLIAAWSESAAAATSS